MSEPIPTRPKRIVKFGHTYRGRPATLVQVLFYADGPLFHAAVCRHLLIANENGQDIQEVAVGLFESDVLLLTQETLTKFGTDGNVWERVWHEHGPDTSSEVCQTIRVLARRVITRWWPEIGKELPGADTDDYVQVAQDWHEGKKPESW